MTLNQFRSILYWLSKFLGDVQSVNKATRTRSAAPIARRLARRAAGRMTGKMLGAMFRGR